MVIIHTNLVIKRNKRSKDINYAQSEAFFFFWKNSAFWSRVDSFPLLGKSSTINLIYFMVVFFFVKLISYKVKNIKGKFPKRIRIITSMLVW